MAVIETLQTAIGSNPLISQYFLNPIGLLGLLALIPLAVFYLMKPKPEEQVMPSMRFFQQDTGTSQLKKAFRTLLRNFVLLLQILAVIGFAVVLAEPFTNTFEQPEDTVLILDRSASMGEEFQELKRQIESRLGEENTLILVDDEVTVRSENSPPSEIKRILDRIQPVQTETDVVSALDTARNYEGELLIASDLDQTYDQRSVSDKLGSHSSRPVEIVNPRKTNDWGITSVEPGRNTTYVEITNFEQTENSIEVRNNNDPRQLELGAEATVRVSFSSTPGQNTITLPEDGFSADNTAYYIVPETETTQVAYIGPVNQYFSTAVQLINGTSLQYVQEEVPETEIYVIGGKVSDAEKLNEIEDKVDSGASAVVFPRSRALSQNFNFEVSPNQVNRTVRINQPQRISLGETTVFENDIAGGDSLATPETAVKIHEYGEGEVMAYNIDETGFRQNFLYPIFWKSAFSRLSDRPDISDLNLETGEIVQENVLNSPKGQRFEEEIELNQTGFYRSENIVYAANLESEDESSLESPDYDLKNSKDTAKIRENAQNIAIILLLLLIGIEIAYLWYRGDL